MGHRETSPRSGSVSTSLLERARDNDQASWRRLVDLYAPFVYRWCRRWGVGADDAPDVVQEVFRRVAGALDGFRREGEHHSFRSWLWRIARNEANDHFRRLAKAPASPGGTDHLLRIRRIPEDLPEGDPALSDEPIRLLHAALDLIKGDFQERTWQAFWRSAILGQETDRIARDLGMEERAARQAKYRVMTRLREEYRGLIDLGPRGG